jgi:hypothetical protein
MAGILYSVKMCGMENQKLAICFGEPPAIVAEKFISALGKFGIIVNVVNVYHNDPTKAEYHYEIIAPPACDGTGCSCNQVPDRSGLAVIGFVVKS